jgi:hypothetical protein
MMLGLEVFAAAVLMKFKDSIRRAIREKWCVVEFIMASGSDPGFNFHPSYTFIKAFVKDLRALALKIHSNCKVV